MKVLGIIAEYNPFHNGHAYHIAESKRKTGATHGVVVMSGNFVQRGEPACALKWIRARAAIEGGTDLVLELPLPYATATAQRFALSSVALLEALGCVDILSFGSESGELSNLLDVANAISGPFGEEFAKSSANGLSFAASRQAEIEKKLGLDKAALLREPNNILAIEYLKALSDLQSDIAPFTLARTEAQYHQISAKGSIISATQARLLLERGDFNDLKQALPSVSFELLCEEFASKRLPTLTSNAERAMLARLRIMNAADWLSLPDMSEGLEGRFLKSVQSCTSLAQLFDSVKTKRYPMSKLRRLVLHAFLGVTAADTNAPPAYIRVLALSARGKELLRKIKKEACLPILTKPADVRKLSPTAQKAFELEARSTDLYGLFTPKVLPCGLDWTTSPVVRRDEKI